MTKKINEARMSEEKLQPQKAELIYISYDACNNRLVGSITLDVGDSMLFNIDKSGRIEINDGEELLHTGMEKKMIEHTFSRFYGNVDFYWTFNATAYIEIIKLIRSEINDADTTLEVDGDAQAVIDGLKPRVMVTPDDLETLAQYLERYFPNGCHGVRCRDCPFDAGGQYESASMCMHLKGKK